MVKNEGIDKALQEKIKNIIATNYSFDSYIQQIINEVMKCG